MLLKIIQFIIIVMFITSTTIFGKAKQSEIVLLPIEQSTLESYQQIDVNNYYNNITNSLLLTNQYSLVPFTIFNETSEKQLIDNAIFEIIVTGELTNTLDLLDKLDQPIKAIDQWCKWGQKSNIKYLITTNLKTTNYGILIHCKIIDTKTTKPIKTITKTMHPNYPRAIETALAKQLTRKLDGINYIAINK